MYYKLGRTCVTNWGSFIFTNWGKCFYKLGQLLQLEQPLLQSKAAITNWDKMYYKLRQVLQIRAIIINWVISVRTPKPGKHIF